MKIIHTADLHLGSSLGSNLNEEKAKIRRNELKHNFVNLVQFAKEENAEAIIIAGDLFDTAKVPANLKKYVLQTIKDAENIKFFFVSGNHDISPFNGDEIPENLFIFENDWTYFNFENICFCGRAIEEFNNQNIFENIDLKENMLNILVLHGQVIKGNAENTPFGINLNLLKNKNIDYLALGHIHEFSQGKIDDRGTYAYPGALEGRGFDECDEKGFILLEIEENSINLNFIPFANRKYFEIYSDISSCENETDFINKIKSDLKNINKEDLVKLVLIGSKTLELTFDLQYARQILNSDFFFVKIIDKTKVKLDFEQLRGDISLKGEFIRLVLDSNDIDEEMKNTIITYGIKALEGEEI